VGDPPTRQASGVDAAEGGPFDGEKHRDTEDIERIGQGRVLAVWLGNGWKVDEVIAALTRAAGN
jgi:hypothetical protein